MICPGIVQMKQFQTNVVYLKNMDKRTNPDQTEQR